MPEWRDDAPEVPPWLTFYLNAWQEVSTDRAYTFGTPLPIPYSRIRGYANDYGIRGEDFEYFLALMRGADRAWLDTQQERREREQKK